LDQPLARLTTRLYCLTMASRLCRLSKLANEDLRLSSGECECRNWMAGKRCCGGAPNSILASTLRDLGTSATKETPWTSTAKVTSQFSESGSFATTIKIDSPSQIICSSGTSPAPFGPL